MLYIERSSRELAVNEKFYSRCKLRFHFFLDLILYGFNSSNWQPLAVSIHKGIATGGGQEGHGPPTSIFKLNNVQQFQFKTPRMLLLLRCSEIMGPEISRFVTCVLQFLDNLRQFFIFSNYIGEIDHFTLDFLKRSDT